MERKVIRTSNQEPHSDDKPSNGPWRITFDTNPDDCNMNCIMCEEHSEFSPLRKARLIEKKKHRRMNVNVIRKTVAEMSAHGLKEIIPSTMGEPLLYRKFLDIIDICRENKVMMNLTTNGTWPVYGPEKWAEIICPVTSDVKVSWNGSNKNIQEAIMKGSNFEKRLDDLKKFIKIRDEIAENGGNRCRITIQATFMETNLEDLPNLVRLAIDVGADRVKGHQLWAHFKEINGLDLRRSEESMKRWNAVAELCKYIVDSSTKKDGTRIILENFNMISVDEPHKVPTEWTCPFLGVEAWVNYEGRFDPCCAPDVQRKSLGYFGNVFSNGGMAEIWFGESYQKLRDNYMENKVCQTCNMRRPKLA
ncbi:radical SAM/SPASM domain-containing protein [Ferroplasma sp.]|uniref:radical SAM protein n=1 Tax=Ferroplasma sp. TaxID=2591003 RepID=UPI00262CD523|nr:radical SAM/SPASM domain-containing protein [Ferroplasma sp.]